MFYFCLCNLTKPILTWLGRDFLWVNQIYMVFYVMLWGNPFEFLKNITVLIMQLTIITISRVIQKNPKPKIYSLTLYTIHYLQYTLYTFRWMYRWLLLLLVLILLYGILKCYKTTIHMICTIAVKQQLITVYNLTTLQMYYIISWSILGLAVVVPAGSQWHMCGGQCLANYSLCS